MILYYLRTGFFDTWRAKRPLLANIVVVAGICLPVLLLLGLRRGLVQQFREAILQSPTACEVTVQAQRADQVFTVAHEKELENSGLNANSVIPTVENAIYHISNPANPAIPEVGTTFTCTKPGDPFLKFYGLDVLAAGDRGILISTGVARQLNVPMVAAGKDKFLPMAPTTLSLSIARKDSPAFTMPVPLRGIYVDEGQKGYIERQMVVWLEQFKQGMAVPELNLPSSDRPPTARYEGFVAFTKVVLDPESLSDLYDIGLTAMELKPSASGDDPRRTLYGLLADRPGQLLLHVYWLYASANKGTQTVNRAAVEVKATIKHSPQKPDCVVMPWSSAQVLNIDGKPHQVIGISTEMKFLQSYFRNAATRLPEDELMTMLLPRPAGESASAGPPVPQGTVHLQLPTAVGEAKSAAVEAQVIDVPGLAAQEPGPPLAVVSAAMASHLGRVRDGILDFDPLSNRFVTPRVEPEFNSARMYANDIQYVPEIVESLHKLGYGASADVTRVNEMLNYARTLTVMVLVIFGSVMIFGILTILFVFSDLTYRKRGAIGIMRIMGMPRPGVLFFFVVRSMVIGMGGAVVAVMVGYGLAMLLKVQWKVGFACSWNDVGWVCLGALITTILGGGWPSWKTAYRLDPVDAIQNARVQ